MEKFTNLDMKQDNKICCSIIVVCKNNLPEVEKTICSVLEEGKMPAGAEIAVVDDSVDANIEQYVKSLSLANLKYLRGDGLSLYSAMNIGIKKASGVYLWFLNSGDCKSEDFDISSLKFEEADLVYGNTDYVENDVIIRKQARPGFKLLPENQLHNFLPCHQSILFRREFLLDKNISYDTRLKISADYKFLGNIVEAGSTILYRPVTISEFTLGGISNQYKSFSQVIAHARELKQTRDLSSIQFLFLALKLCSKLKF